MSLENAMKNSEQLTEKLVENIMGLINLDEYGGDNRNG